MRKRDLEVGRAYAAKLHGLDPADAERHHSLLRKVTVISLDVAPSSSGFSGINRHVTRFPRVRVEFREKGRPASLDLPCYAIACAWEEFVAVRDGIRAHHRREAARRTELESLIRAHLPGTYIPADLENGRAGVDVGDLIDLLRRFEGAVDPGSSVACSDQVDVGGLLDI